MVSSSRFLGAKEGEMPQPMSVQHFGEMVSSSRFWSQFCTELWLSLNVSETDRFQLKCMKIARRALCDVLLPCRSLFISVGQGSHITRGKGPSHGRAIALHGGRWQGSETALISHVSLEKQERMLKMRQLDGPKRTRMY